MKLFRLSVVVFAALCTLSVFTMASASEWGCKCILCLSNPGGATEYEECEPPIRKLFNHLENGGKFPKCNEAEKAGYKVNEGCERYYTCAEAYGEGWELYTQSDYDSRATTVSCRKFLGYKTVTKYCSDEGYECGTEQVPEYQIEPRKARSKPWYIELVASDGTRQRIWYSR